MILNFPSNKLWFYVCFSLRSGFVCRHTTFQSWEQCTNSFQMKKKTRKPFDVLIGNEEEAWAFEEGKFKRIIVQLCELFWEEKQKWMNGKFKIRGKRCRILSLKIACDACWGFGKCSFCFYLKVFMILRWNWGTLTFESNQ